ncbi:MAG: hypothetical protein QOD53_1613 [Thermoleophilaceae bacterium]|nr:hypothetical protein [Thermoleophilaceae bacterium]
MWKVVSKLRYAVYAVAIVAAAVHFGGSATGTTNSAKAEKSPYVRFYGMTAQRGKAWAEVSGHRVHSLNLDVRLRCRSGITATSHMIFVDRGPHGLRIHRDSFKTAWAKDGLTARVRGGLDVRQRVVHGTVSVSGRFAGSACRSGTVRFGASSAPLVRLAS